MLRMLLFRVLPFMLVAAVASTVGFMFRPAPVTAQDEPAFWEVQSWWDGTHPQGDDNAGFEPFAVVWDVKENEAAVFYKRPAH